AARWTPTDTWTFIGFSLGLLLEAYIFGMASIATGWVPMPPNLRSLLLSWAPLWLIIGIATAGPVSDKIGRKQTFILTMSLYGLGAIGIVFSHTYYLILTFLAILLFAAGGEMNTILTATHEVMPTAHRGKAMFMELNFINLGGLLLAVISLLSAYGSVQFQREMLASTILLVVFVLFFVRRRTPESIRWLEKTGQTARAQSEAEKYYGTDIYALRQKSDQLLMAADQHQLHHVSLGIRLFSTIAIAFAGAAGYGLITYVLGPSYFKHLTATIILVSSLVGFVFGFIGLAADRISRKKMLLWGYAGTFIATGIAVLTVATWVRDLALFWILLVAINAFNAVGYLTEDTLKGEIWSTAHRGTLTAVVRFAGIGLYILTIYLTQNYSLHQYMIFNLIVWGIGLAGALVWYVKGVETGQGTDIDAISNQ
ncbi:MAG: MFS transporter, partial [Firmicutes bacterium]|nr:MFS transporter [Bacillota bacterium]